MVKKEWILNIATNRWGLNKKASVGPVSKWIRDVNPKTLEEWKKKYFEKLKEFLTKKGIQLTPEEYLNDLGNKLYVKITEVIQKEIEEVSLEDCINYIEKLVISRTFEGYLTEITTVYGILQKELKELKISIEPAPDELDRKYNVDFYIQVGNNRIGIQIKPITYEQTPEFHKWKNWSETSHKKFEKKFGGKVFIVFSTKINGKNQIIDEENVLNNIKAEIERLKILNSQSR